MDNRKKIENITKKKKIAKSQWQKWSGVWTYHYYTYTIVLNIMSVIMI